MGGLLAAPARQYPESLLAKVPLFQTFPYLLPCLASAALTAGAGLLAVFYLEEVRLDPLPRYWTADLRRVVDADPAVQKDTRVSGPVNARANRDGRSPGKCT